MPKLILLIEVKVRDKLSAIEPDALSQNLS